MIIMKLFNSIVGFLLKDITAYTRRERIIISIFYLVPIPIILIMSLFIVKDGQIIILELILAYFILSIPGVYSFYYAPEKFVERFGYYSDVHPRFTHQSNARLYSLILPGLIAFTLVLGASLNKWTLAIFISSAFVIPFISGFFRTGVFNDSSCIMGDEIVLGYHPFYIIFSLVVGLFGFYNVYKLLNVNYDFAVCLFVATVVFQIIFVIPNWINKIVPFEVRKTEGFVLYNALAGGAYLLISHYLIGNKMFNAMQINLSPENIIKNIIIYGIGAIFFILIIKQGKNMGKK